MRPPRPIQTADLMKKGLRPRWTEAPVRAGDSNRRPDEEGIKTWMLVSYSAAPAIQTADLMKKGLRHCSEHCRVPPRIQTADLMKKGLRQLALELVAALCDSNRRPDEEGIKTGPSSSNSVNATAFKPQT